MLVCLCARAKLNTCCLYLLILLKCAFSSSFKRGWPQKKHLLFSRGSSSFQPYLTYSAQIKQTNKSICSLPRLSKDWDPSLNLHCAEYIFYTLLNRKIQAAIESNIYEIGASVIQLPVHTCICFPNTLTFSLISLSSPWL